MPLPCATLSNYICHHAEANKEACSASLRRLVIGPMGTRQEVPGHPPREPENDVSTQEICKHAAKGPSMVRPPACSWLKLTKPIGHRNWRDTAHEPSRQGMAGNAPETIPEGLPPPRERGVEERMFSRNDSTMGPSSTKHLLRTIGSLRRAGRRVLPLQCSLQARNVSSFVAEKCRANASLPRSGMETWNRAV